MEIPKIQNSVFSWEEKDRQLIKRWVIRWFQFCHKCLFNFLKVKNIIWIYLHIYIAFSISFEDLLLCYCFPSHPYRIIPHLAFTNSFLKGISKWIAFRCKNLFGKNNQQLFMYQGALNRLLNNTSVVNNIY